jgi:cytochrome c oxidase subunit 4
MNDTKAAHQAQAAHHEAHSVRGYLFIYFALLAGTVLTVWASYINFNSREINIAVALVIACTKAFLVAGYFMHLISERKMIYTVLAFTAFFFAGLMTLTLYGIHDTPIHTITH